MREGRQGQLGIKATLVIVAWAVLAAGLGPLLVTYALGGRPTQPVAVLMVVTGLATIYAWRGAGLSASVYEVMPAMLASGLVFIAANLLRRGREPDHEITAHSAGADADRHG